MSNSTFMLILGAGVLLLLARRARAGTGGTGSNAPSREPLRITIDEPLGSPSRGDWPWWADSGAWAG